VERARESDGDVATSDGKKRCDAEDEVAALVEVLEHLMVRT
jgi:uncharacterized membrane protein